MPKKEKVMDDPPEKEEVDPILARKLFIREMSLFIGRYQIALIKLHQKEINEFYIPISALQAAQYTFDLKFNPKLQDFMDELNNILSQFELKAAYKDSVLYRTVIEVQMHGQWLCLPTDEAEDTLNMGSLLITRFFKPKTAE